MSCDRFEGAVGEMVDGTIDDAGRAALDAHLAECREETCAICTGDGALAHDMQEHMAALEDE